ncbi:hypothetical protein ACROYT_G000295 [Oculina patagonica]
MHKGRRRFNATRTSLPVLCKSFVSFMEEARKDCPTDTAEEKWNFIRHVIFNPALHTFGKCEAVIGLVGKRIAELEPAIAAFGSAVAIDAATIDRVASETLAKVEEKCPIITKTPNEIRFLSISVFQAQMFHSSLPTAMVIL